jgi:hypothetical protein
MSITKFRSFKEAEKSLWQFKPDDAYYINLRRLFELFEKLNRPAYPAGIFKYPDLDSANLQKAEWDVIAGLKKSKKFLNRIFHKAKNHKEAEEWDIHQYLRMSPEERQAIAKALKKRIFGERIVDLREAHHRT